MKNLIFSLLFLCFLSSCNNDPTEPSNNNNQANSESLISSMQTYMDYSESLEYAFFIHKSFFEAYVQGKGADTNNYKIVSDTDNYRYAYLKDEAGSITFDNVTLNNQGNGYYYKYFDPFTMNGDSSNLVVSGSQNVPSFSIDFKKPKNHAVIQSVQNGDTHSKSNDLQFTWQQESNENMTVGIEFATSIDDTATTIKSYRETTSDSGAFTIPSSILQTFNNGQYSLRLVRGYYKFDKLPNNDDYGIFAYSSHTIDIILTD